MALRTFFGAFFVVSFTLIVAGCSSRSDDPYAALQRALDLADEAETAQIDITYTARAGSVTGIGALDIANGRAEYTFQDSIGTTEVRTLGRRAFVLSPGAKGWIRTASDEVGDDPLRQAFIGSSPLDVVSDIARAKGTVTSSKSSDEGRVFQLAPKLRLLSEDADTPFLRDLESLEVEVALDDESRLLRFSLVASVQSKSGTRLVELSLAFHDWGAPVDVEQRPMPDATSILKQITPPCFGEKNAACRKPSQELRERYADPHACDGTAPRVCILPVGNMPVGQIEQFRAYMRDRYGLEMAVLPAIEATDAMGKQVNAAEWKVSYDKFSTELRAAHLSVLGTGGRIVAITPVDMYGPGGDGSSFMFGARRNWRESGTDLFGLISTFRMNPETFGEPANDALWFERMRKMATKYVGVLYYGLEETDEPSSALSGPLYSIRAIDAITGHLPVDATTPPAGGIVFRTPAIAPGAPCTGDLRAGCAKPGTPAVSAPSTAACEVAGPVLCLMAAGNVPAAQLEGIAEVLRANGVTVGIVPAFSIADTPIDPATGLTSGWDITAYVDTVYLALEPLREVSFLVVTPVDMSVGRTPAVGVIDVYNDSGTRKPRYAVISTFRSNPQVYGEAADEALWQARIGKLALRAAGLVHFHYPRTDEPTSPMFRRIDSLATLDAMRPSLVP